MAGVEVVIGGALVSAIIRAVIDTGRSYFANKYKVHTGTQNMLDSLEASLPRILSVIGLAERKAIVQDASLTEWLRQLKDVACEAEDVMDDFEANRIRDSLQIKGKVSEIATSSARAVKSVFLSDKDERNLKNLIKKMKNVCDGLGDLIKLINSVNNNVNDGSTSSSIRETSSFLPKTKKIFGREEEIELILDMITGYPEIQSYTYNESGDGPDLVNNESAQDDPSPISEEIISPPQDTQESPVIKREEVDLSNLISHESSVLAISNSALGSKEKNISFLTPGKFLEEGHYISNFQSAYARISFSVGKRHINVLPIVGIGGVGKTTIAQVIYNHPRIQDYFDIRGWVYVVDSTDHSRIVQDILRSFDAGTSYNTPTITRLDDGHHMLKNAISEKKFLIIFDDVREGRGLDPTWKKLLELLAEGAAESIVIVTTEIKSVADALGTLPPISLDVLKWRDFLALFEYHAYDYFNNETGKRYEESGLKPIGEEIARKLGCLPIAAEAVGNLLRIKPDKNHWEKILERNWWGLENTSEKILLSLGVSFQNLDPDLKQCFLYCALFPKNYVFDKDKLVQMWMAHGLIHPTAAEQVKLETKELKMEDIGRSRFDDLVDRIFFKTTVLENRYVMHDLIRELAVAISCGMLYVSGNRLTDDKTIPSFVRHLAIDPNIDDECFVDHVQLSDENRKHLRTIMFFGFCKLSQRKGIYGILDKVGGLRLLDLSYFRTSQFSLDSLPDRVTSQLSHVRFLDLSFSGITKVPNSLCELVHLQVLDIRGCVFKKLPDGMNRLINLRHLYASPHTISLIRGMGSLTNLQELEEYHVRKSEGFTISELKDLKLLNGQLTIKYLEDVPSKDKATDAKLGEKKLLTSLVFDMAGGYKLQRPKNVKHVEVLEGLKPHKNICALSIMRFMWISLPSWMMNIHEMDKLRNIELTQCFSLETLPPLGSLPKLEVLILEKLASIICIGEEFYGTSDVIFPSLRELTFSNFWKWEHWSDPGTRQLFPFLQRLQITNCYELSEAPLHCLKSSVVELHLSKCDEVTKKIGRYFAAMTSLTHLYLHGYIWLKLDLCCDHLRELRGLTLGDIEIPHLEGKMSSLINLKKLIFPRYRERINSSDRQHLQNASQAGHSLLSLACIEVHNCVEIPKVLFSLERFPSLQTLWIQNCDRNNFTNEEDSWFEGLTSLEEMELSNCENLRCLPRSLSTLPSLKKFTLKACPRILSLPQGGLPQSLKELCISECSPALMRGCEPDIGTEWPKISHISYIRVGKQTVQYS